MAFRETEFKYLLDAEKLETLRVALGKPTKTLNFVNRYYSLAGPRERKDWVLRVREDERSAVLTLKIGREVEPGVFDSMEYSAEVVGGPENWEGTEPMRVFRRELSLEPVSLQGEMHNVRECYPAPVPVGTLWEVDRATLPGGYEFSELEVEVEAEVEEWPRLRATLETWLKGLGVMPEASTLTKYARFLAAVEGR